MTDQRDNIAQAIMDQQGGGLKYTAGGQLDQNDAGNIAYYYKMMGGGGGGAPAQPAQAPTATPFPQAQAPQEAYQLPQPGPQGGAYGQPAGGGGGLKMINGQIDPNDPGNIAAYYRMMGGGGGGGAPQQPAYQPQPVAYSPQGVAAIPGNFGPDQVQAMGPQIMQLKAQGQQIPDWQQQVLDAYQGGMAPGTTLAIRGSPAGGPASMAAPSQIQAPGGSYGDGAGISSGGGSGLGGVGGGSDFFGGGSQPYSPGVDPFPTTRIKVGQTEPTVFDTGTGGFNDPFGFGRSTGDLTRYLPATGNLNNPWGVVGIPGYGTDSYGDPFGRGAGSISGGGGFSEGGYNWGGGYNSPWGA